MYPSEIHKYTYCPRLYFFSINLGEKRGLRDRIRLLLGRIFHVIKAIPDRSRGMKVEETNEANVGGVRLRGRPDSYTIDNGVLRVIERKSGRSPRRGAWISDVMQATAYTLILNREGVREAVLEIHYRDGIRRLRVDDELVGNLVKVIDEVVMVKRYGVVPAALRSERKCARCAFKEICYNMDNGVEADLYEPGAWLASRRIL